MAAIVQLARSVLPNPPQPSSYTKADMNKEKAFIQLQAGRYSHFHFRSSFVE